MKIKQYGPRMEELKSESKTIREIAADAGLKHEQIKQCFILNRFRVNLLKDSVVKPLRLFIDYGHSPLHFCL